MNWRGQKTGFVYTARGPRWVYREIISLKQMYQCATKLALPNFLVAMQHANGLRRRFPGKPLDIYPCKFCTGLHVGHCKRSPEIEINDI